MRSLASLVILLATTGVGTAAADRFPVSFTVGGGLVNHEPHENYGFGEFSPWDWGVATTFGLRVPLRWGIEAMLGPHLALSHLEFVDSWVGTLSGEKYGYHTLQLDVAFAVQLARAPIWVTPWLGERTSRMQARSTFFSGKTGEIYSTHVRTEWQGRALSYGVTAGADLVAVREHRVGIFVDCANGGRASERKADTWLDDDMRFTTWTVGVADRW